MVSLTPRFTLLVVMCNTMAVSLLPTSADAAVIPTARSTPAKSNRVQNPIIPLPMHATVKSAAAHKSKAKTTSMESNHESKSRKSKHHKARITGQFNIKPILRLASVAFGKTNAIPTRMMHMLWWT
ncbi:hypothetical protein BD779DRAFT_1470760 [Infundibulicybe gibba]|nr:hypothetical protein BD779DRAFT_1470760 [Infundibulicybe gibba]